MMHRQGFCILLVALGFALSGAAAQAMPPAPPEDIRPSFNTVVGEKCRVLGDIATAFVATRNGGVPLEDVVSGLSPPHSTDIRPYLHEIAVEIYANPAWDAETARREIEARCLAQAPF